MSHPGTRRRSRPRRRGLGWPGSRLDRLPTAVRQRCGWSRDDVPIHGRVLDTQGRPVAGVSVRLGQCAPGRGRPGLAARLRQARCRPGCGILWERRCFLAGRLEHLDERWRRPIRGQGVGRHRLGLLFFHSPALADSSVYVMARPEKCRGLSSPLPNRTTELDGSCREQFSLSTRGLSERRSSWSLVRPSRSPASFA